jgi:arginyl-tRNA--protein-N-Asp/Glu arginylyltransferase
MKSDLIRVFQTLEHPCGYYPERSARNLVIDPLARSLPHVYGTALERGFRRSGGHVYRPHCASCRDCIASRVPVRDFVPDRSQRRCLKRNADLQWQVAPPHRTEANFALYRRYLSARHPEGGMDDPGEEDFERFLACAWSPTRFLEARLGDELLAVAVTDVLPQGLSAVYTFYAPQAQARGLGTAAILRQIEWAREQGLPHLYLGYWIDAHPKMDYKARFRPLERLTDGQWTRA